MKQNQKNNFKINGFTIIELIIVISIMGLMATLLVASFNATRSRRNLTLAANELVTNLRKTQSYALSARDITNDLPAKYYILQFDFTMPNQYQILAIDNKFGPKIITVETISLPLDVQLYEDNTFLEQQIEGGEKSETINPNCLEILFGLPFGRMYMYGANTKHGCIDHDLVNIAKDPAAMAELTNSKAVVYLRSTRGHQTKAGIVYDTKAMEINGLSGTIVPIVEQ